MLTGDVYRLAPTVERRAFATALKRRMVDAGLSATELARRSGMHKQVISTYLTGRNMPGPVTVERLARPLNCRPGDLTRPTMSGTTGAARFAILESDRPGCHHLLASVALPTAVAADIFARISAALGGESP